MIQAPQSATALNESGSELLSSDSATLAGDAKTEPARATVLVPGAVLNDRYLLEQVIGCGGVSIVYRARDMNSSVGPARAVQVALKTPRPEMHDHDRARARLSHEHQHTHALSHPNIVRALDLQVDAEPCFMTMELLEGKLLSAMMGEWKTPPLRRSPTVFCSAAHGRWRTRMGATSFTGTSNPATFSSRGMKRSRSSISAPLLRR